MNERSSALLIAELTGTARSGKGTVVSELAKRYPHIVVEETGADYRAVTYQLLSRGIIRPDMSTEDIKKAVAAIPSRVLTQFAADRSAVVRKYGLQSLYSQEVTALVAAVGAIKAVRVAVKAGFRQRVEKVRDNPENQLLIVDGRNLIAVIEHIPGTELFFRVFLGCSDREAARRECIRHNIALGTPEAEKIYQSIKKRNKTDAERTLDPVLPDPDAINYREYKKAPQGTQIYFDTTDISKKDMIDAVASMLDVALQSRGYPALKDS